MKTKNILLPAIALLAGTLLSAPAFAQLTGDYHDEIENIRQDINIEIPTTPQKIYLSVAALYNQMNEDLPIDYEKLFEAASNSVKENKISDKDQYELMVFAIQTNHNEVLKILLQAGFKGDIDLYLKQSGTTVAPLAEIAQAFKNTEALELIETYTPKKMIKKITPKEIKSLEKIEQRPHGEYLMRTDYNHGAVLMMEPSAYEQMRKLDSIKNELQNKGYTVDTVPATTTTIEVVSDTVPEQEEEGIIGAAYYNEHNTLVIKKFDKPLTGTEYQQWLQKNETMTRIRKNEVPESKYKQMLDSIRRR